MYVIIVGLGGIGRSLVHLATRDKHSVVVIDKDEERCREIAGEYDVLPIVGDATMKSVLEEAGARRADALIATTSDDAANLMTALLAKEIGVKNVVSVVNQQEHAKMFERVGVSIHENPDMVIAEHLYLSMKRPNVRDFISVGEGKGEIFEIRVSEGSKVAEKTLSEISLKKGLIIAIERENKIIIPKGNTRILPGDLVTVLTQSQDVEKVISLFTGKG
ncbi:MAG: potassium channel family protein [Candidatus Syntropharchaeia archaeon]